MMTEKGKYVYNSISEFLYMDANIIFVITYSDKSNSAKHDQLNVDLIDIQTKEQLKLKLITDRKLEVYPVEQNCELREFVTELLNIKFRKGHAFYELTHEKEDVSEDKELIILYKVYMTLYISHAKKKGYLTRLGYLSRIWYLSPDNYYKYFCTNEKCPSLYLN